MRTNPAPAPNDLEIMQPDTSNVRRRRRRNLARGACCAVGSLALAGIVAASLEGVRHSHAPARPTPPLPQGGRVPPTGGPAAGPGSAGPTRSAPAPRGPLPVTNAPAPAPRGPLPVTNAPAPVLGALPPPVVAAAPKPLVPAPAPASDAPPAFRSAGFTFDTFFASGAAGETAYFAFSDTDDICAAIAGTATASLSFGVARPRLQPLTVGRYSHFTGVQNVTQMANVTTPPTGVTGYAEAYGALLGSPFVVDISTLSRDATTNTTGTYTLGGGERSDFSAMHCFGHAQGS